MAHYLVKIIVMLGGYEYTQKAVVLACSETEAEGKAEAMLKGGWFTHNDYSYYDSDTEWFNFRNDEAARIDSVTQVPEDDGRVLAKYL